MASSLYPPPPESVSSRKQKRIGCAPAGHRGRLGHRRGARASPCSDAPGRRRGDLASTVHHRFQMLLSRGWTAGPESSTPEFIKKKKRTRCERNMNPALGGSETKRTPSLQTGPSQFWRRIGTAESWITCWGANIIPTKRNMPAPT